MKKRFNLSRGRGIASLLTIVVVFVMLIYMSHSLIISYEEIQMTKACVTQNQIYYEAETKANQKLLEIQEIYDIYCSSASSRGDLLEKALQEVEGVTHVKLDTITTVEYEIIIDECQYIAVTLEMPLKSNDLRVLETLEKEDKTNLEGVEMQKETQEKLQEDVTGEALKLVSWQVKS